MQKASDFCYVRSQKKRQEKKELKQQIESLQAMDARQDEVDREPHPIMQNYSDEEIDTNVIIIKFDFLKNDKQNLAMGDPILCKQCHACINKYSNVVTGQQYLQMPEGKKNQDKAPQSQEMIVEQQQPNDVQKQIQQDKKQADKADNEEEKKMEVELPQDKKVESMKKENLIQPVDVKEGDKVWVCEFCKYPNVIQVEPEEIPKEEDVIYMLKSAEQIKDQSKVVLSDKQKDISIILCIDISGSMNVTQEIEGKVNLKHGITEDEYNMLKQFIEPGDENQEYPYFGHNKNKTYVSRKQCVLAAIEDQLSQMQKEHPERIVGLVTFNNEVVVIGDGSKEDHVIITGDKLQKFDQIEENAKKAYIKYMTQPINQSLQNITNVLNKMQTKGQTALGPGLLASLTLATEGKPGSMVILCTDGLANIGLGSFMEQNDQQSIEFYNKLEKLALDKGVSISIITIKGEGCKLDVLGQISQKTNGNITRVDPKDISRDFAQILKDEIVGTKVHMEMRLHRSMKFRNELPEFLKEGNSLYIKEIGNVTVNSTVTFEYELKSDEELVQLHLQDEVDQIKEFPFQTQIKYTTLEGHEFLRVLTSTQKVTHERRQAEMQARVNVIHNRIAQQSAQFVQLGNFEKAKYYNKKWEGYVESNDNINMDQANLYQNQEFQCKQKVFKKAVNSKVSRQLKLSKPAQSKGSSKDQEQQAEQKPGFFAKLFSGSQKPQQVPVNQAAYSVDKQIKSQSQEKNLQSIKEQEVEETQVLQKKLKKQILFSASEGSESDEDQDEAVIVQYQQQKK